MADRLRCIVPFCRRTRKPERFAEWICGPHWTATDRGLRRRLFRYRRLEKKLAAIGRPTERMRGFIDGVWRQLKDQACERAGGIA